MIQITIHRYEVDLPEDVGGVFVVHLKILYSVLMTLGIQEKYPFGLIPKSFSVQFSQEIINSSD